MHSARHAHRVLDYSAHVQRQPAFRYHLVVVVLMVVAVGLLLLRGLDLHDRHPRLADLADRRRLAHRSTAVLADAAPLALTGWQTATPLADAGQPGSCQVPADRPPAVLAAVELTAEVNFRCF